MTVRLDTQMLDRLIAAFPSYAEETVAKGAVAVQGYAQQQAPVDTGALKNSLQASRQSALLWWVHDGVEYGVYQELGTSRMRAHPFLRPAVEMMQKQYPDLWKAIFDRL